MKPRGGTDRPRESYPDWQHVANRAERFTMAPGGELRAGEAGGTPRPTTISSGVDTVANGGLPLVTYTAEALSGRPPATFLPAVDRKHGAVWTSDQLSERHPFDMRLGDLFEYATDRATRRLRAIESARGADVARIDVDVEPERLEDEFGAEDRAALNRG